MPRSTLPACGSVSKDLGTELSGQIGFSAMEEMKVLINYRDGLVKFVGK